MYIKSVIAAAALSAMASAASAMTVGVTEGERELVEGTEKISNNQALNGYDLLAGQSNFSGGDVAEVYGRIFGTDDIYTFTVGDGVKTSISLILGNVKLDNGGTILSGVTGELMDGSPSTDDVTFSLQQRDPIFNDEIGSPLSKSITPDYTSGAALLFADLASGYYELTISSNGAALYAFSAATRGDVSAVPVPAALPLLMASIVGLGFVGRKRRAA